MKISRNWLNDYIDITDLSTEELADTLTLLGLEIESIEHPGEEIQEVCVGKILSIDPHPDADSIVVCKTDVGRDAPLTICCGATNMKAGDKVPTAVIGATLPGDFKITKRKMRGIASEGMMCSTKELGLGEDADGLMILPEDYEIGTDIRPYIGLDDVVFEIEVTPNRGDWASMIGVARELSARLGRPLKTPDVAIAEEGPEIGTLTSVTVEDTARCPRYMGRMLQAVTVQPSPEWLARRLRAAGQRPINNIVDITNFVLLETGQPLHAFDYDKLAESRIVVRTAKDGEKMTTLDDEERSLDSETLVIADAKHPQCIGGVMGGAESEVGEGTTNIFLESAFFDPISVRKTSRKLALISESSQRFQRGADPEMAAWALDRAAALMQECGGAKVSTGVLDEYPEPMVPRQVTLRYARTNDFLGQPVPMDKQRAYLEGLGFEVIHSDAEECTVRVPLRRHDVSHEADLIEEVARLHGYDQFPATLPRVRQNDQVFAPEDNQVRGLRRFLVGKGLTEFYSWTFTNQADLDKCRVPLGDGRRPVALENPLSEKQALMRPTLLPTLLNSATHNLNRGNADIAAFELGPVYADETGEDAAVQSLNLGILLAGNAEPAHWTHEARPVDIFDLKGILEAVAAYTGKELTLEADDAVGPYQKGQSAVVRCGKDVIGHCGKMSVSVCDGFGFDALVYVAEVTVDALVKKAPKSAAFQEIPAFPKSLRDLAVVVDQSLPVGELVGTINKSGGKFLKEVEVFDIYTGDQVDSGKKSVAFRLAFQSPEKTLTDKNTQKFMDGIVKQLDKQHGAALR
jgi:phenylalanyl-tRNA synthetase beta chain